MAKAPAARMVILFGNGNIAVCDAQGRQIPELQGADTDDLRAAIMARADELTEWRVSAEAPEPINEFAARVTTAFAGEARRQRQAGEKVDIYAAACLAILAMREPTKPMIAAGARVTDAGAGAVWRAMVDAALEDSDPPAGPPSIEKVNS